MSEFGEVLFSLNEILIAPYNILTDLYTSDPALMDFDQQVEIEFETATDELWDSGKKARKLAVITGAKLKIAAGSFDWNVIAMLLGTTNETSGTTPNRVRAITYPEQLPYFGLIGVADSDDDPAGVAVIGVRCAKLDKPFKYTFNGKDPKFVVNDDIAGTALFVGSMLVRPKIYETASDWATARPTTGALFKSFFA